MKWEVWVRAQAFSSVLVSLATKLLCALVSTKTRTSTVWWFKIGSRLWHIISIFSSPVEPYKWGTRTFIIPSLHMSKFKLRESRGTTHGQSIAEGELKLMCPFHLSHTHSLNWFLGSLCSMKIVLCWQMARELLADCLSLRGCFNNLLTFRASISSCSSYIRRIWWGWNDKLWKIK